MKQRRESVEAQMVRTAGSIGDPLSRRIFMQLMGAAGISLGAKWTGMIGEAAAEGVKRGKIAYQIDVLHQYWVQWEKGFDGTTAALELEPAKLFHGSDPARQIGQVRSLKASGVNMFVASPACRLRPIPSAPPASNRLWRNIRASNWSAKSAATGPRKVAGRRCCR